MKREAQEMKNTLKEYANRDRQREINYKKQQAYLFEVEKKWREVNGDYFPDIKKRKQERLPSHSRVVTDRSHKAGSHYVNPLEQRDFV